MPRPEHQGRPHGLDGERRRATLSTPEAPIVRLRIASLCRSVKGDARTEFVPQDLASEEGRGWLPRDCRLLDLHRRLRQELSATTGPGAWCSSSSYCSSSGPPGGAAPGLRPRSAGRPALRAGAAARGTDRGESAETTEIAAAGPEGPSATCARDSLGWRCPSRTPGPAPLPPSERGRSIDSSRPVLCLCRVPAPNVTAPQPGRRLGARAVCRPRRPATSSATG